MFVITLVALGAAVTAWLRPIPETKSATPTAPTFSDHQVADAKSKVCVAYAKIHRAVDINAPRNGGDDPMAQLTVAVNMRQVYVIGSALLLTTLVDEPATPGDLAATTSKVARLLQGLTLDGLTSNINAQENDVVNKTGETIETLCK
jgi:hypothetical protein